MKTRNRKLIEIKAQINTKEIFLRFIFYMWTIFFLKSLLNLLQYYFCFMVFGFLAMKHVGFQFSDQGSNPHPLHWKAKT